MSAPAIDIFADNRRPPRLTRWKPKMWRPEYERMVAYSTLGWSNTRIAKELGYTKEHVSNVLNTPQAEALKEQLLKRLHEVAVTSIPDNLEYIARRTTERLKKVLDDDELFDKSPFAVIDRGMDVLKGLSHLKGGGNGAGSINVNSAIILPISAAENLASGLNKANEVRQLHAPKDEK